MAALPYIPWFPADYLADTEHLSDAEHGVYLKILFKYWIRGKAFPLSRIHNVVNKTPEEFEPFKQALAEFFEEKEGLWIHARMEADLQAAYETVAAKSKGGKTSALVRKSRKRAKDFLEADAGNQEKPFPMDMKWEPRSEIAAIVVDSRWASTAEFYRKILPEWQLYWKDRGDKRTQTGWEQTLLTYIQEGKTH